MSIAEESPIEVPPEALSPETLTRIIEEFITREGTDYGHEDHSIDEKIAQVRAQISRKKVKIFYDPKSESCTLVSTAAI